MKKLLQFYLTVILAVALFDVIASLTSRMFVFDYTKLFWASGCIYFIAGFVGCKRLGFKGGITAGLVAGLADATLGWFLSTAVGPYLPNHQEHYGIVIVGITIVVVSMLVTFLGGFGAAVAKLLNRGRPSTAAEQALGADSP